MKTLFVAFVRSVSYRRYRAFGPISVVVDDDGINSWIQVYLFGRYLFELVYDGYSHEMYFNGRAG